MNGKTSDNAVKDKETLMSEEELRKSLMHKYDLLIVAHIIIAAKFVNDGDEVRAAKNAKLAEMLSDICIAIESGELFN